MQCRTSQNKKKEITVLASMDGIPGYLMEKHWDSYMESQRNFSLRTENPSITTPVHMSVLTGRHTWEHGIFENVILEQEKYERQELYEPEKEIAEKLIASNTILSKLSESGKKCCTINWPLAEGLPGKNYITPMCEHVQEDSVRQAAEKDRMAWDILQRELEEGQMDFIAVHFLEYDAAAHIYGSESPEGIHALEKMKRYIDMLVKNIDNREVNFIFFSDHGVTDRTDTFFPNIFLAERGLKEQLEHRQIYCLADGSGSVIFYSRLSEEKNKEILEILEQSGKTDGIERAKHQKLRSEYAAYPEAVINLKKGVCAEDILPGEAERYRDMKGLHGYAQDKVEEMKGFFLLYDPHRRIPDTQKCFEVTDIIKFVKIFVNEESEDLKNEHK